MTPSVSQVAGSHNWLSSQQIDESILLMPEVFPDIIKARGKQDFTIGSISKTMGGVNYVKNMNQRSSEENFIHEVVKVETQSAGSANASQTYTIASAYEYDYPADGIAAPYITLGVGGNATTTVPLYVNHVIEFPNGVQAIVTDVTGNQFTAYPRVSGDSMPATTTSDIIIILGNQVGEAATQNPSRDMQLIWNFTNLQNMNGSYEISGTARTEKTWVKTDKGYLWYWYAQEVEKQRLMNEREQMIVTNKKTTNTTFADLDRYTATSASFDGMIPMMESYGNTMTYNLISGITLQDFEDLVLGQLMPQIAGNEYAVYSAGQPLVFVSRFQRAEGKNGGIVYNALGKPEDYIQYSFNSFNVAGHTFHFKHYGMLDYKNGLGAAGHKYSSMFLGLPLDKTNRSVNWDDVTVSKETPQFVINYLKSEDGYNREWEDFMLGGANGIYTEAVDRISVNYRSTFGLQMFAMNRYFIGSKE